MYKTIISAFFIFLTFNICSAQEAEQYVSDELIVKFKNNSSVNLTNCIFHQRFENDILDSLNNEFQVQRIKVLGNKKVRETYLLKFKNDQNILELIDIYQGTGLFDYVEPNFIGKGGGVQGSMMTSPNDTHFSRQYGLNNDGSFTLSPATNDADVDMDLAWDIEKGDPSIIVAVLDAGLKLDHPEFDGRVWYNASETSNGTDDDNNGYVDDVVGWDFANSDNDPTDDHGHGTNVTGIIGAKSDNNLGYAGVDWNCKLMICKVIDQNNSGNYSWFVDAVYYAVDNGAKVINMSVGGASFSNALQIAIDYAYNNGVTVVACMMNENNSVRYYPAGYLNTIAVGSTNANDERSSPFFWSASSGSNFGIHIDVVAPGNYIYGLDYSSNTNYESFWGGTSQATPLVAGVCALLLAQRPGITPDEIRAILRNTAEDQVGNSSEDVAGFDIYYGYGRVNAHQALLNVGTSINETDLGEESLNVYPNPCEETVYIEGSFNQAAISVVNILGSVVLRKEFVANTNLLKLDVSELHEGVYILNITDKGNHTLDSKRLVIN